MLTMTVTQRPRATSDLAASLTDDAMEILGRAGVRGDGLDGTRDVAGADGRNRARVGYSSARSSSEDVRLAGVIEQALHRAALRVAWRVRCRRNPGRDRSSTAARGRVASLACHRKGRTGSTRHAAPAGEPPPAGAVRDGPCPPGDGAETEGSLLRRAYLRSGSDVVPVRPTGVEPVTYGSEDRCSIQLSYGRSRDPQRRIIPTRHAAATAPAPTIRHSGGKGYPLGPVRASIILHLDPARPPRSSTRPGPASGSEEQAPCRNPRRNPRRRARAAQQQAEIVLIEKDAHVAYSNFARVTSTAEEVIIDFCLNPNPFPTGRQEINVSQRLIMNFYTAKRLFSALGMTLQRHEQTFGAIELDIRRRAPASRAAARSNISGLHKASLGARASGQASRAP